MASGEYQKDVTSGLTTRPQLLDLSPSASRQNSRCLTDGDNTDGISSDAYEEDAELTKLLQEYAENDSSYEGYAVAATNNEDDDIAKDGPVISKKKEVCNISVGNSPQQLQLLSNGKPMDKMVSTPVTDGDPPYVHLFHHSGPSNKVSVVTLHEDQSPQLEPVYDEKKLDSRSKIQFALQPSQPLPTPPGSERVKMVSETKLLLAMDYSNQLNPKLITLQYSEMKKTLIAIKKGEDIKMKPIINVRVYPNKPATDNTALYFRVDQYYYFLCVDESKLHLEIKTVPMELGQPPDYINFTSFAPTTIHSGAVLLKKGSDNTDGEVDNAEATDTKTGAVKEVVLSPSVGTEQGSTATTVPSTGTTFSVLKLKKTGSDSTASDSGIDTRSPDSNEEGKAIQKK